MDARRERGALRECIICGEVEEVRAWDMCRRCYDKWRKGKINHPTKGTHTPRTRGPRRKVPDGRHLGVCVDCGKKCRVDCRLNVCQLCMSQRREKAGRVDGDWLYL